MPKFCSEYADCLAKLYTTQRLPHCILVICHVTMLLKGMVQQIFSVCCNLVTQQEAILGDFIAYILSHTG